METYDYGSGYVDEREMEEPTVRMLIDQVNDMRNKVYKLKEKVTIAEEKFRMLSVYATIVGGFCFVNFVVGLFVMMIRKG